MIQFESSKLSRLRCALSIASVVAFVPTTAQAQLQPTTVASAPTAATSAGPSVCPASCDKRCEVCCRAWVPAVACADGRRLSASGQTFATQAQALASKPPDALIATCGDPAATAAIAVCAPGNAEASPFDTPAQAKAAAALSVVETSTEKVSSTEARLRAFLTARTLNGAGSKKGQALLDRFRSTQRALMAASFDARKSRGNQATDTDLARAMQESQDATALATQLTTDTMAYLDDPSNIDAAAEAREKAHLEAIEAARRKKEEAEEAARRRVEAARAATQAAEQRRRDAEAERLAAEQKRIDDAAVARADAARRVADLEAKKRADADAKEKERRDAELAQQQATAQKQAAAASASASAAAAAESSLKTKVDHDFEEADGRLRSDLDTCSQNIATLTMVEMSSRGLAKVTDAKVALQNHKDKLRGLLGRLAVAKSRVPIKAAADETAKVNEESKALSKETVRLVANAKSLKN